MRNRSVETVRAFATLGMLSYHLSAMIGIPENHFGASLMEVIGRFSLMAFFIISGYGTYHYYSSAKEKGKKVSGTYIRKRFLSIAPAYWLVLVFLLLYNMNAGFLDSKKIMSPILEFLFLSNLFPKMNFVNGAAWTVSLMMQFYILSGVIYRFVEKHEAKGIAFLLVFVALLRVGAETIVKKIGCEPIYHTYISVRFPILSFDLFILGILIAKYPQKNKTGRRGAAVSIAVYILIITAVALYGTRNGLYYTISVSYVIWRYGGAVAVAFLIRVVERIDGNSAGLLGRCMSSLARNSYGIYLCHMPLIANLFAFSPVFVQLKSSRPLFCAAIVAVLAISSGTVITQLTSSERYRKNFLWLVNKTEI